MRLSPHEIEKLRLHNVGFLAQKRLARGTRLNIPEAVALLVTQVMELARSGEHSVATLMDIGRSMLGRRQVIPGTADVLDEVQVEATFPDGSKLVTLHHPICLENGDLELALRGSFLPIPPFTSFQDHPEEGLIPGQITTLPGSIQINTGRVHRNISVTNTSDRPIQVGSHFHFIETNKLLQFNRMASYGMRLNVYVTPLYRINLTNPRLVSHSKEINIPDCMCGTHGILFLYFFPVLLYFSFFPS